MSQEKFKISMDLTKEDTVISKLLKNWRQILLVGSIFLFAYLIYHQRDELIMVRNILWQGKWGYSILALALQLIFYALQAAMYRRILSSWMPIDFKKIYRITLASNSLNKLLPSGGISGLGLFISEAKERGIDTSLSLVANALFYSLDYLAFLLIVWWGLYFYGSAIGLGQNARWVISAFTLLITLIIILLIIAIQSEYGLKQCLSFLNNRIPWLTSKLLTLNKALQLLKKRQQNFTKNLLITFIYASLMQLVDITILYLCFQIVKYPVRIGTVTAGFGLSSITAMISMVPQGIGIYETAMTWIFNHMGVNFSIAVTVTILYRGITFWFAIIPGLLTMPGRKWGSV